MAGTDIDKPNTADGSGAPLVFKADSVAATGTYVMNLNGLGPARIFVTPRGSTLTSMAVSIDGAALDSSVFNSTSVGVTRMLWVDRPINTLTLTGVGGGTVDIRVTRWVGY